MCHFTQSTYYLLYDLLLLLLIHCIFYFTHYTLYYVLYISLSYCGNTSSKFYDTCTFMPPYVGKFFASTVRTIGQHFDRRVKLSTNSTPHAKITPFLFVSGADEFHPREAWNPVTRSEDSRVSRRPKKGALRVSFLCNTRCQFHTGQPFVLPRGPRVLKLFCAVSRVSISRVDARVPGGRPPKCNRASHPAMLPRWSRATPPLLLPCFHRFVACDPLTWQEWRKRSQPQRESHCRARFSKRSTIHRVVEKSRLLCLQLETLKFRNWATEMNLFRTETNNQPISIRSDFEKII